MPPLTPHLTQVSSQAIPLVARGAANDAPSAKDTFSSSGVDLLAMVVSDSGLANSEPQWWNASPLGCFLIGLQPRGGWQVMQRSVQWGKDRWARSFGVVCEDPVLYAYFACTIRNRIERWDSPRFWSPMEGASDKEWISVKDFRMKRPTKLMDGSRGGQAFMADLLRPNEDKHYSIHEQAHAQLLSVLLVAAGTMLDEGLKDIEETVKIDFGLSMDLGQAFGNLRIALIIAEILVLSLVVSVLYSLFEHNLYKRSIPYMVQLTSQLCWITGATGLLMSGGNPRVRIIQRKLPSHVQTRLGKLYEDASEPSQAAFIEVRFGSLHGSVYTADQGSCTIPLQVVQQICGWNFETARSWKWYLGEIYFGLYLLASMGLQIAGSRVQTLGSEIMGIAFLLSTSIARGAGVSGSEEWMIPRGKRRKDTAYGAQLLGAMSSRGLSVNGS